jgi:hypothetical protein
MRAKRRRLSPSRLRARLSAVLLFFHAQSVFAHLALLWLSFFRPLTMQLDTCEAIKAKWRESLLGKLKRINEPAGPAGSAASTPLFATEKAPATSAYIASLEKTNKELQTSLQVCSVVRPPLTLF